MLDGRKWQSIRLAIVTMQQPISDRDIEELLAMRKSITRAQMRRLSLPTKKQGRQLVAVASTVSGRRRFRIVSQRNINPNKPKSFSIILQTVVHGKWFNLIRCNGHHGPHENKLEQRSGTGIQFIPGNVCHVHLATERYQRTEMDPEYYAEPTDRYSTLEEAVEHMCGHYGVWLSDDPYHSPRPLFE